LKVPANSDVGPTQCLRPGHTTKFRDKATIEEYVRLGYNYRMTDIQAAVGIEQMKKLDWIVSRRRELAARYTEALSGHPWLRAPYFPNYAEPNFQSYAVQLTDDAPISRDELLQRLLDAGMSTRRGIMLAHIEPAYLASACSQPLHVSERASLRSLLLPLYPQMTNTDQDRVVTACNRLPNWERWSSR
jgi:perosamine synthetase